MNVSTTKNITKICTILTLTLTCSVNACFESYISPEEQNKAAEMYAKNYYAAARKVALIIDQIRGSTPLLPTVIAHGIMPYLMNRFTLLATAPLHIPSCCYVKSVVLLSNTKLAIQHYKLDDHLLLPIMVVEVSTGRHIETIESLPKGINFPATELSSCDHYVLTESPKSTYIAAQNGFWERLPKLTISLKENLKKVVYDESNGKNSVNDIDRYTDEAAFSPEENSFAITHRSRFSFFARVDTDIQMPID